MVKSAILIISSREAGRHHSRYRRSARCPTRHSEIASCSSKTREFEPTELEYTPEKHRNNAILTNKNHAHQEKAGFWGSKNWIFSNKHRFHHTITVQSAVSSKYGSLLDLLYQPRIDYPHRTISDWFTETTLEIPFFLLLTVRLLVLVSPHDIQHFVKGV